MDPYAIIAIGIGLGWTGALMIFMGYEPWYTIGTVLVVAGLVVLTRMSTNPWTEVLGYIVAGSVAASWAVELFGKPGPDQWDKAEEEYENGFEEFDA